MSSRRHGSPPHGSRSTQVPGMARHGSYPVGHHITELPYPERDDRQLVAESAEVERLESHNRTLATSHVALRQELVATTQDIQKLRAHIATIQTESDVQIRSLLDKIGKMEVDVQAGENVKKELQKAHTEARSLVITRQDLIGQIERSTQELQKVRTDVEKLPELHVELDGLKQEHQKLRLIFEHQKRLNMDKVKELELMDNDLVGMAREMERLRAEITNAEKWASAPHMYGGPYVKQEYYPPPPMHASSGGYVDGYGTYHHPYGGGHPGVAAPGGNPQWGPPQMVPYGVGHPGVAAPPRGRGGPPPAHNNSRT